MCQQFSTSGVKINLLHIPGHTGIPGSTTADMHVKDTAYKIFKGEIAAPINVSISTAFTVAGDIAKKSWQRLWDHEQTGRYTYNLIPLVNSKVLFPLQRDIGISYCRLLLHDTMLKYDSHKSGTSDSPLCDCGLAKETSDHFLFHCSLYGSIREEMFDQLSQVCVKKNKTIQIIESLMLAPHNEFSELSKNQNITVKDLLFQFLSSTNREI